MAEGEGFEPPEAARLQWFSRPPHSTALPTLHRAFGKQGMVAIFILKTEEPQDRLCLISDDEARRSRLVMICSVIYGQQSMNK